MVVTFPSDLDIFSPVNWSIPLWAQMRANGAARSAADAQGYLAGLKAVLASPAL